MIHWSKSWSVALGGARAPVLQPAPRYRPGDEHRARHDEALDALDQEATGAAILHRGRAAAGVTALLAGLAAFLGLVALGRRSGLVAALGLPPGREDPSEGAVRVPSD